ncbi:MAG TPA: enoyl-CoA hydratase/isomerase family protein [Ilumatobacter sp.]
MDLTTMSYEVRDRVAHVRFTRPEGANAVSPAFSADLRAVMVAIEFDPDVRAVSVTADGKVFCAGGDLKLFHEAGAEVPALAADMLVDYHGAIYKMNSIPKPFVAGVRGAAGGAGLSLMSAFDLVVSGESAKYTMAYTRAGVTPDGTSSYFIARHVGLRRMLDLTLTNRVLTAAEAEDWGLVNRVVPDDEVDRATADLAQQLADGPAWATGHAKTVVYHGYEHALQAAGDFEGVMITAAMAGHDGQEGIAAFAQKRAPEFTGE